MALTSVPHKKITDLSAADFLSRVSPRPLRVLPESSERVDAPQLERHVQPSMRAADDLASARGFAVGMLLSGLICCATLLTLWLAPHH